MESVIEGDREYQCYICKSWQNIQVHHIYKGKNRKISDRNGFIVHLCSKCHDELHGKKGHLMDLYLMKTCQLEYEKNHTRAEFMKLIGCNYIMEDED